MKPGALHRRSLLHRLWARQDWSVGAKLIAVTVPLLAVLSLVAAVVEHVRITAGLQEKLAARARSIAHQIMADRQYYASVVVPRAKELGATFGPDYKAVHGRFPLPATFVREVSEDLAKVRDGYTASLISPWPINKAKGIRDEFEREGFAFLQAHPQELFIRTDTVEGRAVMRVLMADLASAPSCVSCHNAHEQSPKHDFRLNDLMGGLEIVMPMEQYLAENRTNLLLTLAGGGVMCLLVLMIVWAGSRRAIAQPLDELADRMRAFGGGGAGGGPAAIAGDEVAYLGGAFDRMKAVIAAQQQELLEANQSLERRVVERTEQLRRTMEEKERIGSELRIASEIQRSILPRTFPPFPDREDFDLYADTIPAREMGGDFYDFFLLDAERLGVVVADVSGKGVPAAIFMAVSRTMLKATALQGVSPGDCLQHVNDLLCPENDSAMFVTVFYGILNTRTGEFEYGNAGHNLPYRLLGDGGPEPLENPKGMALGVMENLRYRVSRTVLRPGEGLFLYTDGVTEALDAEGNLFGPPRLEALLRRHGGAASLDLVRATVAEVRAYSGEAPQADDITLLALRYRGGRPR